MVGDLLGTPPTLLQKVALDIRGKRTTGKAKNNLDEDSGERTQVPNTHLYRPLCCNFALSASCKCPQIR